MKTQIKYVISNVVKSIGILAYDIKFSFRQDLNVETDDTGEFGPAQFTDTDLVACPSDEDGTVYSNEPSTSGDPYG